MFSSNFHNRQNPDEVDLTAKLGLLLYKNEMVSKGLDKILQVQHVSVNHPGNLNLCLAVGASLFEGKKDWESSLYRYKVAGISESPILWNNVGLCFYHRKKIIMALSCLKRAVYLNPFEPRINYNLGLLNLIVGQYASAFIFLKAAVSLSNGQDSNMFSTLAISLEMLSDEVNSRHAHVSATKSAVKSNQTVPIVNFAIYLHNRDVKGFKDLIIQLLLEFEKVWSRKKPQNNDASDSDIMRLVSLLTSAVNMDSQLITSESITPEATAPHEDSQALPAPEAAEDALVANGQPQASPGDETPA